VKPSLAFIVPGEPVPCARPRMGKGGHFYVPSETTEFEETVAFHALRSLNAQPTWAELALNPRVRFWVLIDFFVRVASTGEELFDLDNAVKSVLDGVNKANEYELNLRKIVRGKPQKIFKRGIWKDDRRVRACIGTVHTELRGGYRTEVVIEPAQVHLDKPVWMAIALEQGWAPPRAAAAGGST